MRSSSNFQSRRTERHRDTRLFQVHLFSFAAFYKQVGPGSNCRAIQVHKAPGQNHQTT